MPPRNVFVHRIAMGRPGRRGAARLAKLAGSFPDDVYPRHAYIFAVRKAFFEYTRHAIGAGGDTVYWVSNFKAG